MTCLQSTGGKKGNMLMGVGVEGGGGGQKYQPLCPFWNVWEVLLKVFLHRYAGGGGQTRLDRGRRAGWAVPTASLACDSLLTHSFMCVLSRASQIWSSVYWLKGSKFDLERNARGMSQGSFMCTATLRRLWGKSLNKCGKRP